MSRAWLLSSGTDQVVAKLSSDEQAHFELGLELSELVNADGLRTGVPIRTRQGELSVALDGRRLAVLEHVPGRAPTPDDLDPFGLGRILGRVHSSIAIAAGPGAAWTVDDVCDQTRDGMLAEHPTWIVEFVNDAIARVQSWRPPREQMLRGDGFEILLEDGAISGLIDWGATRWGSVADDIGCWTVHLGPMCGGYAAATRTLIDGYRTTAPLSDEEAEAVVLYQRLRLATRPAYVSDLRELSASSTGSTGGSRARPIRSTRRPGERRATPPRRACSPSSEARHPGRARPRPALARRSPS